MKKNRGTKWMAVLVATALVAALATTAEARPGPAFHHHHHHGGSFVGAMVGTALAVGVLGALTSVAEPEPAVVVQQQPVVYQPAPVVQQPVVVQSGEQQQVVYQPAPVVVQQPTVVYQTAPVVRYYRYSPWW